MTRMTRRRALFIGAAAALSLSAGRATQAAEATWRGVALGADAQIRLRHVDATDAAPVFAAVEAELARLESIFSLYRSDSALARLNRDGALDNPPAEMLELLSIAGAAHAETDGLFDPTVQPLFQLYAEAGAAGRKVAPDHLSGALALVGFDAVTITAARVHLTRPGMAMTLNGIAQGYITDRIAAVLRAQGLRDILVDMGEIAAIGDGPARGGWRVALANGGPVLTLSDAAVATSAPLGTTLDPEGRVGHILHPQQGWTRMEQRQVSVVAESAALADALSTAGTLMTGERLRVLERADRRIFTL
jgi:thiamine biosynthesis lipoprotein